jgi:hypothetical protein
MARRIKVKGIRKSRWMIWMYESSEGGYGMPLLLFVYEWDRVGSGIELAFVPWVKIVFSCDANADWDGGDLGWDVFDQPYLFSKLVASGEARRVGPVPFDMPPPGEGMTRSETVAQPQRTKVSPLFSR